MTAKIIKCESHDEAKFKAEAFKDMIEGKQIIVIDEYLCIGQPGEWVETTQTFDGTTGKYKTEIHTDIEELKKTEEWLEDFESKTKVK